ncbi:disease resistance protein (TIR-NBS-LRR class), partial [Trifolium medium]|nr:disease resistance protein (TIR-NBS-LRR class) [Trifolium medium]
MECSRTLDQMVIPVFYDVDPSHVCHHETMIGEALKDLAQRIESRVDSNISGFAVVDS